MKYSKIIRYKLRNLLSFFTSHIVIYTFIIIYIALSMTSEGITLEDLGINLDFNPFDYCHLTDIDYTAELLTEEADKSAIKPFSEYKTLDNLSELDQKRMYSYFNYNGYFGNNSNNHLHPAGVKITEYLTYDIHAAFKSNMFKELWRELPEDTVDGLEVTYDVESVTQIMPDGTEEPYKNTSKMYWEDYDYTKNSTKFWHHSKKKGRYPDNDESLLMYIPWTYRDKLKFKIVYYMNNAVLKYNDCSELYLSIYSGNTIKHLKSFKAQILIPDEMMPESYYAYTYGTAKSKVPYSLSNSKNPGFNTFSIDLDKSDLKFNYHNRFIEFCLLSYGKDKHSISPNAPDNKYSNEDVLDECIKENEYYTNRNAIFNACKIGLLVLSIIISKIIIYLTKKNYEKNKSQYTFYKPETDYEYFREIPSDLDPYFASELVFMKDPFNRNKEKGEEYASILLSLERKKYVKIEKVDENLDWDSNNTSINLEPLYSTYTTPISLDEEPDFITINKDTAEKLEPLTTSERLYLNLIERVVSISNSSSQNHITLANFQTYMNNNEELADAFVTDMEKEPMIEVGLIKGYFQQTDYNVLKDKYEKASNRSATIAFLLLIGANFISYFTPLAFGFGAYTILGLVFLWKSLFLTSKLPESILLTQYGVDEQAKWCGLYNFLNSDTLINEKEVHELPLWEKYLIYATAFGISEKVIKAIKLHIQEMDVDTSPILYHHSFIHSSAFHSTSKSLGHSIHTSSRSFGGHGYGGGGRGGGGGGGGH